MRGQRYWEEKVPIYTEVKEVREERKQKYLQEAKKYYNISIETSNLKYNQLKEEILNGNEDARKELMERSINPIIDALAGIYAKYDVEEVVPFEDGLSHSLDLFNKNLKSFKDFPRLWSEYSVSTINFYVFNTLTFYYQFMKYDAKSVEYLQESSLAWQLDKIDSEMFSYKNIVREDVRHRIIAIMSKLESRSARILALRFGLFDGCEKTCEEISEMENISRSRVDQIAKQAIHKIRKPKNHKLLKMYKDANLDLID